MGANLSSTRLGELVVNGELGDGAEVVSARRNGTDVFVRCAASGSGPFDSASVQSWSEELETLHDDSLPKYYGIDFAEDHSSGQARLVLVMDHVHGRRLSQIIRSGPAPEEAFRACVRLAEGMRSLHDRHIAHGAVGPENVIIEGDTAKLVDVPTFPESLSSDRATPQYDLDLEGYGALLFAAATGQDFDKRRPFEAAVLANTPGEPIAGVIGRLLAPPEGLGFATAAQVVDALQVALGLEAPKDDVSTVEGSSDAEIDAFERLRARVRRIARPIVEEALRTHARPEALDRVTTANDVLRSLANGEWNDFSRAVTAEVHSLTESLSRAIPPTRGLVDWHTEEVAAAFSGHWLTLIREALNDPSALRDNDCPLDRDLVPSHIKRLRNENPAYERQLSRFHEFAENLCIGPEGVENLGLRLAASFEDENQRVRLPGDIGLERRDPGGTWTVHRMKPDPRLREES